MIDDQMCIPRTITVKIDEVVLDAVRSHLRSMGMRGSTSDAVRWALQKVIRDVARENVDNNVASSLKTAEVAKRNAAADAAKARAEAARYKIDVEERKSANRIHRLEIGEKRRQQERENEQQMIARDGAEKRRLAAIPAGADSDHPDYDIVTAYRKRLGIPDEAWSKMCINARGEIERAAMNSAI